jgi:hypothetical protein
MNILVSIVDFIFYFAPVWGPILVIVIAWRVWVHYIQQAFISGIEWDLLEVKIPRDVYKTPQAMELIMANAMFQVSEKGLTELYWQGAVWFWFSLEIVSLGGQVHFFIRTPSRITGLLESQIYAQYPQAEVVKVPDYTDELPQTLESGCGWKIWGCEFAYADSPVFKIKTYPEWGLDKPSDKEDMKIDPLTPVIEFFGSIKPDERLWLQIMVRGQKMKFKKRGSWFGKKISWQEYAHQEMDEVLKPYTQVKDSGSMEIRVPDKLKNKVEDAYKKVNNMCFDVGIRFVYAAKEHAYENNTQKASRLIFRQYSAFDTNRLERTYSTQYDYPWFDPTGKFLISMKERTLDQYRRREYFYPKLHRSFNYPWPISLSYPSYHPRPMVMSIEELATLFHFPGRVSETPTFRRVESRKAAPPPNLPV